MGILMNTSEAAATLLAGVDALRNERKNVSARRRVINGIIIVGANAINECEVDLHAGDHYFGRFRNSRAGVAAPIIDEDFQPISPTWVVGDKITATIVVAPTVSPLLIQIHGEER